MTMLQFEVEREYACSAERVWAITGDFGGLHVWAPGVTGCRVEGAGAADDGGNAVRIIDVFDGSITRERLETFDAGNRRYSYSIEQAQGLDRSNAYQATFTVTPLAPDRCRIVWGARFLLPGLAPEKAERAQARFAQMYTMCLQNLDGVLARG